MIELPGLRFALGEDIDMLRATVRGFAQAEIARAPPRSTAPTSFPPICGRRWARSGFSASPWKTPMAGP